MIKLISEILAILSFTAILVFVGFKYKTSTADVKLSGYKVEIADSSNIGFVTKNDILYKLSEFNLKTNSTSIKDINIQAIENKIETDNYIYTANVCVDMFGVLKVKIEQFIPQLRVINANGISYFIDTNYRLVRQRNYMSLDVPIITTEVETFNLQSLDAITQKLKQGEQPLTDAEKDAMSKIDNMIALCKYIRTDDFWNSLVVQVNVNNKEEIEFIPRVGNQLIVLCKLDAVGNYIKYTEKLKKFYFSDSDAPVLSKYSKIDLKYDKLIVCTKKSVR